MAWLAQDTAGNRLVNAGGLGVVAANVDIEQHRPQKCGVSSLVFADFSGFAILRRPIEPVALS
jgi:hypothetical protein